MLILSIYNIQSIIYHPPPASYLTTIKFRFLEELQELQARIYLDLKKKLTKQELLEVIYKIGTKEYDQILREIRLSNQNELTDEIIEIVLARVIDLGDGTERLSEEIDQTLYGKKRGV